VEYLIAVGIIILVVGSLVLLTDYPSMRDDNWP